MYFKHHIRNMTHINNYYDFNHILLYSYPKKEQKDLILLRLQLAKTIRISIKIFIELLGIEVADRM